MLWLGAAKGVGVGDEWLLGLSRTTHAIEMVINLGLDASRGSSS